MDNDYGSGADGEPRKSGEPRWGTAIVVGGSIAGIIAARVLTDHFEQVLVIDRDTMPAIPSHRRGASHAYHFHGLLTRGRLILEHLFPGLTEELVRQSAPFACQTLSSKNMRRYGWMPRFASNLYSLCACRELLEWSIRHRALAHPRILLEDKSTVIGLVTARGGEKVLGVHATSQGSTAVRTLQADLVVDASGRGSNAPAWLETVGCERPRETTIDAGWGYASCYFEARKLPEDLHSVGGHPLAGAGSGPTRTRGGFLLGIDNGRWQVSLYGAQGDHPPMDPQGFLAFARSLAFPDIADALQDAKPLGPIRGWSNTINRFRHYDQTKLPEGFVVLADAAAAFNPAYGQGMSVAALGVMDLDAELTAQSEYDGLAGLSARFQKRLAHTYFGPWTAATSADYRFDNVKGSPVTAETLKRIRYFDRLEALTAEDTDICLKMLETNHMIRSADWMFAEDIKERVQRDWVRLGRRVGARDLMA